MFPQIEHLAIKESSASPSLFSRYGIHNLPSILIVNQTSRMRYHGPKDLPSLIKFYRKTTRRLHERLLKNKKGGSHFFFFSLSLSYHTPDYILPTCSSLFLSFIFFIFSFFYVSSHNFFLVDTDITFIR